MCNLPEGKVFSKEANVPMSDINFLGIKIRDFLVQTPDPSAHQSRIC